MNLLCDILFGLRVMLLNMLSYLCKLLHFVQKFIKLLRQSSFGLRGLCTCLSKILNQMKIRNRFVHFSIFFYFKELVWQNFGYLCIHVLDVYSNDLENGNNKQGVSGLGVHEVREYANTPQVFAKTNYSKQKSICIVCSPLVCCPHSSNHLSTPLLYLNNLKNWLRKITEYSHVFVPNAHTLCSSLVLCSNSLNHSSIFLNRVFLEFYLYLEFI